MDAQSCPCPWIRGNQDVECVVVKWVIVLFGSRRPVFLSERQVGLLFFYWSKQPAPVAFTFDKEQWTIIRRNAMSYPESSYAANPLCITEAFLVYAVRETEWKRWHMRPRSRSRRQSSRRSTRNIKDDIQIACFLQLERKLANDEWSTILYHSPDRWAKPAVASDPASVWWFQPHAVPVADDHDPWFRKCTGLCPCRTWSKIIS